ncbi:MAG: PAS domain S-box protein, partial [Candidatus Hydrothermarchaeales archaeon]
MTKEPRELRDFLETIISNIGEGVQVIDRDYRIVWVNDPLLELSKRTKGELIGEHCYKVFHGFSDVCPECAVRETFETGKPSQISHSGVTGDGSTRYVELNSYPIKDSKGNIIQVVETVRDITERMKLEQKIKESEKKYRTLIETMNEGIGVINKERRITFSNARFADMLEYDVDELIGKDALSLFDEENKKRVIEELKKRAKGRSSIYEIEFTTKTGRQLPALMAATPLFDEKGKHKGSFAVITDLTERKRLEDEIKKSRDYLEMVINSSADAIVNLDENGIVKLWNRGAEEIFGWKAEEILGKPFYPLVPDELKDEATQLFKEVKEKGFLRDYETERVRKDGSKIWVNLTANALKDEAGNFIGLSGIARDVTERKLEEEETRLLQEINYMLNAGTTRDEVLKEIAHGLASIFGYDASVIHLLSEDGKNLIVKAFSVDSKIMKKIEELTGITASNYKIPISRESMFLSLIESKEPIITDDMVELTKQHTDKRHLKALARPIVEIAGLKYGLGVPILSFDRVVGVIGVASRKELTEKDAERLKTFGAQIGVAIEKARLDEQIKEYSEQLEQKVKEKTKELKESRDAVLNVLEDLDESHKELQRAYEELKSL